MQKLKTVGAVHTHTHTHTHTIHFNKINTKANSLAFACNIKKTDYM